MFATVYDTHMYPHIADWIAKENDENLVKDREDHYGESKITLKSSLWDQYNDTVVIIRLKNSATDEEVKAKPKCLLYLDIHWSCKPSPRLIYCTRKGPERLLITSISMMLVKV